MNLFSKPVGFPRLVVLPVGLYGIHAKASVQTADNSNQSLRVAHSPPLVVMDPVCTNCGGIHAAAL